MTQNCSLNRKRLLKIGRCEVFFQVRGVGHPGGFDQQHVGLDRGAEFVEALDEVGLDADAENGALADLHHVDVVAFDQGAVDADFTEFVDQQGQFAVFWKAVDDAV